MKPINNKSLLHFIFDTMEKLDQQSVSVDVAKAQAHLAKQANNSLKYEIERTRLLIDLDKHRAETGNAIDFRNAEGKNFE